MSEILKEWFIIDVSSIRGSKDEEQQLRISEETMQTNDSKSEDNNQLTNIILFMINQIQISMKDNWIILFFNCKTRYYEEIKVKISQLNKNNNILLLIGQQSLFYFLGRKVKEFSFLKWISKEKMFFSHTFIETAWEFDYSPNLKVYPLFKFDNAIKKLNWS